MFQGEATASAKALRQDMLGIFKDYQGGQCGKGRVFEGENKGDKGVGCGSLMGTHISSYSEYSEDQQRVPYLCLVQSNFNPIQKPERELALLGHPDALLQADLCRTALLRWSLGPSKRLFAPAATRPPFSASCCMRVHTDIKGIIGHVLAKAAFFLTLLFIQQTLLGLLDMSGVSLGLEAPW